MSDTFPPRAARNEGSQRPTGALRWSRPPPAPDAPPDALHVLLAWTDELDDERAITLWAGLSVVDDDPAREAALLRWIDWAGVTVPLDVKVRALVEAVAQLLRELEATAQSPDRVYAYQNADLPPLARALQGWMRAKESQPGVVLGALQALVLLRESMRAWTERMRRRPPRPAAPPRADFEVNPGAPEGERITAHEILQALSSVPPHDPFGVSVALVAGCVRRRVERGPVEEAVELLVTWLQAEGIVELPAWGAATVDFALLAGELQGVHFHPLAQLATRAPSVWTRLAAWGDSARDALRAARLLGALASHPGAARELSPTAADVAQEALFELLAHPRPAVWSRAARAIGRLAGYLPGLSHRLLEALHGDSAVLRLRAVATLGTLSHFAGAELHEQRALAMRALEGAAGDAGSDPGVVAALAVTLPDLALDETSAWHELAGRIAARGGVDAAIPLLRSLLEIRLRDPSTREVVELIARDLAARAEAWRGSAADAERAERALALAARASAPEEGTVWGLVAELARAAALDPAAPSLAGEVTAFAAEMDVLITSSARAGGDDNPRVAARGSVVLEEVVDLLVDGELQVVAARAVAPEARAAAEEAAHATRTRILKQVWSGLRRPTPAAFTWRRWLLRAGGALARASRGDRRPDEPDPVFETLERVADDPMFGHAALARHLAATLAELAQPLAASLGPDPVVPVLAWLAVRGALLATHVRLKRWLGEDAPPEALERLFARVESFERPSRDLARDIAELGVLAGGDACRLGVVLTALGAECVDLAQRRPEAHWSGLPRFDLTGLAALADALRRVRDDAAYGLTLGGARPSSQPPGAPPASKSDALAERAARVNRTLTATSLKFMDGPRRAEVVEHYLSELGALAEAIASACGPLLEPQVRSLLARALVAVRAQASAAGSGREEGVRYIARMRVLGELSSAHEGGMTSTFLAEGGAPGKKVVVKLLRWEKFRGTSAELARGMFEGEMERLASVVHPNIVSIMDAGFVDEGAYIALEYIPGASLETLLRVLGRVELKALGPVVRDVARALAWLHARRVIHRDIKPGNVLVQLEPPPHGAFDARAWGTSEVVRAVLIDFGVATETARAGSSEGVTGTPGYIAPEIARGLNLFGPAVDVYALGVLIFEMLTGRNPFLEGNPELNTVLVRHGSTVVPWQELPKEASRPELVQLLADSTRLDPRLRPSMKDFLSRWTRALGIGA
ncbi:MAG: protein kinase [Polyangiales bacterium]